MPVIPVISPVSSFTVTPPLQKTACIHICIYSYQQYNNINNSVHAAYMRNLIVTSFFLFLQVFLKMCNSVLHQW